MATEEARALLDSLMGGDRNAPLPRGAALPRRKRVHPDHHSSDPHDNTFLLLPGKRQKSCFDPDIDPLYTAWGVDVYDLFINTKSDLGTNPKVVDDGARQEFLSLSRDEQERLGCHYWLFQKLQELVRQCDRTVHRNKEKLQQEWNRKQQQQNTAKLGADFTVEHVDDAAVETLVRNMIQKEELQTELDAKLKELDETVEKEEIYMSELEPLLETQQLQQRQNGEQSTAEPMKEEAEAQSDANEHSEGTTLVAIKKEESDIKAEDTLTNDDSVVKQENAVIKQDEDSLNTSEIKTDPILAAPKLQELQLQLGKLTLTKQRLVFDISRILSRLPALIDAVDSQRRNLDYVKSDVSTDKTVCEVSGNFMSARDADERIAAHYAGKQYVGWKLVRDKLAEMIKHYGRYGPPPPPTQQQLNAPMQSFQQHRLGGGGGDPGRGGMYHRAPPSGGGYSGGAGGAFGRSGGDGGRGGGGRFDDRGGGGYRGRGSAGPDRSGRWERQGPLPPAMAPQPPVHGMGGAGGARGGTGGYRDGGRDGRSGTAGGAGGSWRGRPRYH